MKMNSTKTRIGSTMKKAAKKPTSEIVCINVKKQKSTLLSDCNVNEMAKRLKHRLSNVAKRCKKMAIETVTEPKVVAKQQNVHITHTPMASPTLSNESLITTTTTTTTLPLDSPPISPTTMLADADWSITPPPQKSTLYNLQVLKQYLTFISEETQIQINDNGIQLNVSNDIQLKSPETDIQHASRLGATLIELAIHDPTMKIDPIIKQNVKTPNGASRTSHHNNSRRRPGRPPKASQKLLENTEQQLRMKNKRQTILQRQQEQQQQKKKESIDCICNVAHEEFGTMVQCDDCLSWLHLDCLELDEKALEETFRCPSCFIKFGSGDNEAKLLSTVTWRYAAKYQSEVLAGLTSVTHDDEEFEYEEDEDEDMDTEVSAFSYNEDISMFQLEDNDWCDSSVSNSSQDGDSEAGTPAEYQVTDDYWFAPPSAANVFLWDNKTPTVIPILTNSLSTADIEPSAVCDQELPQFNFWDATY